MSCEYCSEPPALRLTSLGQTFQIPHWSLWSSRARLIFVIPHCCLFALRIILSIVFKLFRWILFFLADWRWSDSSLAGGGARHVGDLCSVSCYAMFKEGKQASTTTLKCIFYHLCGFVCLYWRWLKLTMMLFDSSRSDRNALPWTRKFFESTLSTESNCMCFNDKC